MADLLSMYKAMVSFPALKGEKYLKLEVWRFTEKLLEPKLCCLTQGAKRRQD